jgi:DNA-binding NarL/FixJ family response regulator
MELQSQLSIAILIVEDHPPTLAAMQALVSAALPACRLLAAESAEQAIELCMSQAPRVVVIDIALPGIDGIEATRRIKSRWPDTQVVMHSSHDMQIYRDASVAAGAASFVSKTKTFSDLVPAIAGLLPPAFSRSDGA